MRSFLKKYKTTDVRLCFAWGQSLLILKHSVRFISNVKLETSKKNQNDYKSRSNIFRKSRKRIKTLFSKLCDQFIIRNNYAKNLEGFETRILAKITALKLVE